MFWCAANVTTSVNFLLLNADIMAAHTYLFYLCYPFKIRQLFSSGLKTKFMFLGFGRLLNQNTQLSLCY